MNPRHVDTWSDGGVSTVTRAAAGNVDTSSFSSSTLAESTDMEWWPDSSSCHNRIVLSREAVAANSVAVVSECCLPKLGEGAPVVEEPLEDLDDDAFAAVAAVDDVAVDLVASRESCGARLSLPLLFPLPVASETGGEASVGTALGDGEKSSTGRVSAGDMEGGGSGARRAAAAGLITFLPAASNPLPPPLPQSPPFPSSSTSSVMLVTSGVTVSGPVGTRWLGGTSSEIIAGEAGDDAVPLAWPILLLLL